LISLIPQNSKPKLNKSIKEAENEDEDPINTSIDQDPESRNIFLSHKRYDPNLFNEMNIGPKFKKNGQIVPYSIVGKSDSFMKSYNILKS